MLYPLKMVPCFKDYIWGGDNLRKKFGKNTPPPPVAESWEGACHEDGISRVENGIYAMNYLKEMSEIWGSGLLGENMEKDDVFPLLLKILDAQDDLSVQVHPDDEYAKIHENGGKGKTELWYILDAKDGAGILYGFKENITKEMYKKSIEDGTLLDILNFIPCEAGDTFFIPAGTVHAVGKGLVIAEIQQNSNTTYRVFDYNRISADGKSRELHIDKALDVSCLSSTTGSGKLSGKEIKTGENTRICYVENKYFAFEKLIISKCLQENILGRMELLLVAGGSGEIGGVPCKIGDSFVIPAGLGCYDIKGSMEILKFYVPA